MQDSRIQNEMLDDAPVASDIKELLPKESNFIKLVLISLFAALWAIWIQPHTIFLRHTLLTAGSLLGLYVIAQNKSLLWSRRAIPIYLIGLLFAWITFHLLFLSHQYDLQLEEYTTIWKRVAWGAPFAIGLGIAMKGDKRNQSSDSIDSNSAIIASGPAWWIFYAGILTPTMLYLLRAVLMVVAPKFGWVLPEALMNLYPPSTWYIPKTGYVFFCLPALAIACQQLLQILEVRKIADSKMLIIYVASVLAAVSVFYLENIKNGMAYSVIVILYALAKFIFSRGKRMNLRSSLVITIMLIGLSFFVVRHIEKNNSWATFMSDVRVAERLKEIDSWKYYGGKGYPSNDLGSMVSQTNYERAAWAQVALKFIKEMPQGYGLVLESFGHRARELWPDSKLLQSHSGWLDLTLGIGIPGILLIVLAGLLGLKNTIQKNDGFWSDISVWILSSIALLMITTEVSQKTYIDALIFLILWSSAMGVASNTKFSKSKTY